MSCEKCQEAIFYRSAKTQIVACLCGEVYILYNSLFCKLVEFSFSDRFYALIKNECGFYSTIQLHPEEWSFLLDLGKKLVVPEVVGFLPSSPKNSAGQ